jgi:hypothetical protein
MGGSASKPATPGLDLTKASFSADYVQQLQQSSARALAESQKAVSVATSSAGWAWRLVKWFLFFYI